MLTMYPVVTYILHFFTSDMAIILILGVFIVVLNSNLGSAGL